MPGQEDGGDFLSLVASRPPLKRQEPEGEATSQGEAFATVTGGRTAPALRFIRQGGKPFSMPYGLLPIIWGDHLPEMLLIEYPGFFTVRLTGHGLDPLERLLSESRVTWIRAIPKEEAATLPLAVTAIDLLKTYPSRDIGQAVPALREPETA